MKVKSLEKDNAKLKDHEEFYINKAREWKNRALKYERVLQERGIPVPTRGDKVKTVVVESDKENTVDTSNHQASNSMSTSRQTMDTSSAKETSVAAAPASPTIKLNLFNRQEPRMTEEDFKLPEGSRKKPDDCKTQ